MDNGYAERLTAAISRLADTLDRQRQPLRCDCCQKVHDELTIIKGTAYCRTCYNTLDRCADAMYKAGFNVDDWEPALRRLLALCPECAGKDSQLPGLYCLACKGKRSDAR